MPAVVVQFNETKRVLNMSTVQNLGEGHAVHPVQVYTICIVCAVCQTDAVSHGANEGIANVV